MKKRPSAPPVFSMNARAPYIDDEIEGSSPIVIQGRLAFCQGSGPSGHPRVYLTLEPDGQAVCPYCNQVYQNPE